MSSYIIDFKNTSGETGTIIADVGFNYTEKLNEINKANVKISGSSTSKRSLIEIGSEVFIYRNGSLEFHGFTDNVDFLDGGGISVFASGYESWLAKENGDYSSSPWDNIASATIFSSLIGESNYFSAGTINTGLNIDFRAEPTESIWNILSNLKTKTSQDIGIDYVNSEIDILDHKGSSTSVATFNSGIQIKNIRVSQSYPLGNDIRVYGKGDGENQIKSDFSTAGQDATSKSTYGIIRKIIRDPSVLTIDEADLLADSLLTTYKDPVKIYDFDVINPNQSLVVGDVITLNASSQSLSNEEVRIVKIERGIKSGMEYLTLEVTNKEYSLLVKNINEVVAGIEKNFRDQQTYMQGTTNVLTFSQQINATSAAPLRTQGNLPTSFITDEAGKLRINSFTCDYDVDPFRSNVGAASEDDIAPGVSGSSGSTAPGVSGTSSSTQPGVSGDSGNTAPGVSGSSASISSAYYPMNGSFSSVSCSSGSWTTVDTISSTSFISSYGSAMAVGNALVCYLWMQESSGGPEDIYVRIYNSYSGEEFVSYIPGFDTTSGKFIISNVGAGIFTSSGQEVRFQVKPVTGSLSIGGLVGLGTNYHLHGDGTYGANSHPHSDGGYYANNHGHSDGSYAADSHPHTDGSYSADSHNHNVSVGDAVSDAGSINAAEVDIYVDWWNGSSWVQKHSILNTGKTLDTDVDISNGGTLPDAAGYWRTRIYPDNASADLVNSIMKVKHELDT